MNGLSLDRPRRWAHLRPDRRQRRIRDMANDSAPPARRRGRPAPRSTTASPPSSANGSSRCSRRSASTGRSTSRLFPAWPRAKLPFLLCSARSTRSKAARRPLSRSARRWPANGASPPRSRCAPGTCSPRNAPRRSVNRRETGGWRFMFITFAYMLALAYAAAFITYRLAVALGVG